jgi:DNA-binding MarR family transcriptional regulator
MTEKSPQPEMDAYEFIRKSIDSVPHLEALMLLWNSRPAGWTPEELATRLYIPSEQVKHLLRDLVRLQLITQSQASPQKYSYSSESEDQNELMRQVDAAYRRDLVRISTMIHSKASSSVREFARAFRFKKERD